MPRVLPILYFLVHLVTVSCTIARATFSVHFPWSTREDPPAHRHQLDRFEPFCGIPKHNPQRFSGFKPTFLSFSGNAGDLVTVRYTRSRVPRSREDFIFLIASDVPISPSGQLCFDIQMPTPLQTSEYGVFLFEARDPVSGRVMKYYCSDVKLVDKESLAVDHPAMCAANNETLIPMPDEFLHQRREE